MNKEEERQSLLQQAYGLFEEFRGAYAGEWQRLDHAERMYRGEHWHNVPKGDPNEPRPVTPVLQSTVENVSADLMDLFPEAVITPENPEDDLPAQVLEALIKQNHDATSYNREYRKLVHDLLVGGYMVQEVGYDPGLNNGLGGAFIRQVDTRGVLFDPLCTDIQLGRGVFKFAARTREWLAEHFPGKTDFMHADAYTMLEVMEDDVLTADHSKCVLLLEYWWREYDREAGRYRVHMAQLAGGELLSDSREQKPEGYFSHGQYPFVVTPLFPRKGSALGLGLVDMFETQQRYADKLDQIVLKNALMASHNKLLVTEASGFDLEDLRDWSKDVHRGESLGGVTWFSTPPLPAYLMNYIASIRASIKEESGANDFSRGATMGGVTAASAISALQEMSSKRARMAARQMHEAYKDAVRMEIEVEREFNFFPRRVTLTRNGEKETHIFDNRLFSHKGKKGEALPVEFFISIKVQKENRWSVLAQNELVLQMLQLQAITPVQAVELMHFDGKEMVLQRMAQKEEQAQRAEKQQAGQTQGDGGNGTLFIPMQKKAEAPSTQKRQGLLQRLRSRTGRQ